MTRLATLVVAAAFVVASSASLAQGTATPDAQKATPATPATPPAEDAKKKQKKKQKNKSAQADPTKTQKRAGDPQGAAKGQTK
jgi:hypothetical protein